VLFAKEDISRDPLTEKIIGAAIEVHRTLGPGLLESVYVRCLCYELTKLGFSFVHEQPIPVKYKDVIIDCGFRLDIVVEGKVIIEIKACDDIHPVHEAQLLTYLKLTNIRRGLLLNFNVFLLKDGIRRFII
jgi:GxxExxY protein